MATVAMSMSGKFNASKLGDLLTADCRKARAARQAQYKANPQFGNFAAVVHIEADDGSWCELDAESRDHAETLAKNWVNVMNARGASCRDLRDASSGALRLRPFFTVYAPIPDLED